MAERILVIRLGAVGDVVRTLPAVSALRATYPRAHLAWLVEPAAAPLLAVQPWVDDVIVFPRPELVGALRGGRWSGAVAETKRFVAALRAGGFDLVVDFHSILKSSLLARVSGAPRRVGYAPPFGREQSWRLATDRARLEPARGSRFERNLALLRFLGATARPDPRPLRIPRATLAAMRDTLASGSSDRSPGPVILHPGTSPGAAHKRYPAHRFAEVARGLAGWCGRPVLVTAGPSDDDRRLAAAVVGSSEGAAAHAPETASLVDLAALFAHCALVIGSDTGPLHVSSLVGTPIVQILGPTDPVENEPWPETRWRRVRVPVGCSPCRRGCAAAPCMTGVPSHLVIDAARELLGQRARPEPGARGGQAMSAAIASSSTGPS